MPSCRNCQSVNQKKFAAELAIHFHGRQNLDKPHVPLCPVLLICLDCGFVEFVVGEQDLLKLKDGPGNYPSPDNRSLGKLN